MQLIRPSSANSNKVEPKQRKNEEGQLRKNQILEALSLHEKELLAIKGVAQYQSKVEALFKNLNNYAMKFYEQYGAPESCILILQWVIQHRSFQEVPSQICLAYNNLGCVYRRQNSTQLAFNSFENALQLVQMYDQIKMATVTYLNITAVLSQMNMHDKAVKAATKAIEYGKKEFEPNQIETIRRLALAHFNLGFELETLDKLEDAVKQYKRALQFVLEHLGNKDPLFQRFGNQHAQAKQKLMALLSSQQPGLMKNVLALKKQYEVPTDESMVQQTPQQTTKKNFHIKKNNYIEDQVESVVSLKESATIKKGLTDEENGKQIVETDAKSQVTQKKKVEDIQFQDWSNSEPSDTEIKKQRITEQSQQLKGQPAKLGNKEQRLNFLSKQNAYKLVDDNLMEKEMQIIREIEGQIYNVKNISLIQANIRMRQEKRKFIKMKQAKKDQGELLPSDELKLKKFQRFIRRKLAQLHIREITKQAVKKFKLRKNPKKEDVAKQRVIGLLQAYKCHKQLLLIRMVRKQQQFHTLRSAYCKPTIIEDDKIILNKESYIFTFSITSDDSFVRFALVHGNKELRKETRYGFEMDQQSFLKALGLLYQCIEELECFIIDENQTLRNLKKLQTMANQFLSIYESDFKYKIKNQTDNQKSYRLAIQRVGFILQDLLYLNNNKLYIKGLNDFEYDDNVPPILEQKEIKPPLYAKNLTKLELDSIKVIQSFMRGVLQRVKVKKWVGQNNKKQVVNSQLIKTAAGDYLQLVRALNQRNQKEYLYIINQSTQKKSNDLQYKEVVFTNMGELSKENMNDILTIDLNVPSIEYTDEAEYWIQKQIDFEKRGGKRVISNRTKEEQICMIQRSILSYLLKRRCQMSKLTRNKLSMNNNNKNLTREMLVRRVLIYGSDMNSRACLTTLYLDIERVEQQAEQLDQTEYQSVLITSKNLEHVYSFDKVIPFYQKLFYPLPRTEMITVAQKMVEESRITKNKKGEQKVECRNVDEVHGELLSLFGEEEDATEKKENTLEPRLKIGQVLRKKYLEQQIRNLGDLPEKHQLQADQHHLNNFQRNLQLRFRNHQFLIASKICNTKHVDVEEYLSEKNWESVKNYVNNVLPTTEYGTDPTLFIEEELEVEEDPLAMGQHQDLLLDQDVIINGISFRLLIFYQPSTQMFLANAEDVHTHQVYETSIAKKSISDDIPYIYIKENVQTVLLLLIEFYDDQLEFVMDELRLQKIRKDYDESKFNEIGQQPELVEGLEDIEQTTELVTIGVYPKGGCTLTYEFRREELMVRIIIQFTASNESRVIEIDLHQFQSKYVDEKLKDMSNPKIIRFFKEFSRVITKVIYINEKELTHNFEDLRPDLPIYLREKFIQKIQGMLMVKRMVEKLRMYKLLRYSKLFMHKFIINNGQHYIEVIYFLIKKTYKLQLTFREITFVTPQGQLVERSKTLKSKRRLREKSFEISLRELKNDSKSLIASLPKRQDQMDLQRIDFNLLSDYQQMKTIEYYRNLMTPLINIIQKNLFANFNKFQFQLTIPIDLKEMKMRIKKQKTLKTSKFSYTTLLYAVEKLQSIYKRRFHESWYQQKMERKRVVENKNKHYGVFVNRTFKLIRDDDKQYYYIVNVYQKEGKIKAQLKFTFELIPVYRHERKQRLRTVYSWDPTELVHLGTDKLFTYFLNKIYIENSIIKFQEVEYIPFQGEAAEYYSPYASQQQIQLNRNAGSIVEKDVQEILIDQEQIGQSVFNVVYTDLKPLIEKKPVDPAAQNTITLQVNLQDIKKLYPNRDIRDINTMKILSQNLIKGVKMDPNGSVYMDKGRIQSSFLNTVNRSTILQQKVEGKKPRLKERPINFQVLAKDTVYYAGEKYLIVIKLIRNRIQKILSEDRDSVFEDHERMIEIKAQNLNQKTQEPIIWCITPDEAEILTHEQQIEEVAKVLTKHLQVLNGKFIYLCINEKDQLKIKLKQEDNVILFVEHIMQPIQRKFRNRKYHKFYKMYTDIRKKVKDDQQFYLLQVSNLNTKSSVFIVLIVEDNKKKVTLMAWEASDAFYFYEIEVPVKKYLSTYQEDKTKCLKAMLNFFEFKQDINKLQFQHPKPEQVADYFEQEKKLSMHSSSRLGSPDKSEQHTHSQKFIYQQQEYDQTPQSPLDAIEQQLDQQGDEIDEVQSIQFVKN